jgi:hypothetical protein
MQALKASSTQSHLLVARLKTRFRDTCGLDSAIRIRGRECSPCEMNTVVGKCSINELLYLSAAAYGRISLRLPGPPVPRHRNPAGLRGG